MAVLIKQQKGFRNILGKDVEFELPQDEIYLTGKEYPIPKRVGHVLREKDAAINLTMTVSESDEAEIRAAVAARELDGGAVESRKVSTAPQIQQTRK